MAAIDDYRVWRNNLSPQERLGNPNLRTGMRNVEVPDTKWDFFKALSKGPAVLLTSQLTKKVAGTEDEPFWQRELAEYEAWNSPWGVKAVLENVPQFLIPGGVGAGLRALGVSAKVASAAQSGSKLAKGLQGVGKVLAPKLGKSPKEIADAMEVTKGKINPVVKFNADKGEWGIMSHQEQLESIKMSSVKELASKFMNVPIVNKAIQALGGHEMFSSATPKSLQQFAHTELTIYAQTVASADNITALVHGAKMERFGNPVRLLQVDKNGFAQVLKEPVPVADLLDNFARYADSFTDPRAKEAVEEAIKQINYTKKMATEYGITVPKDIYHRTVLGKYVDGKFIKSEEGASWGMGREYKTAAEGIADGMVYETDLNKILESYIRHYVTQIAKRNLVEATKPFEKIARGMAGVQTRKANLQYNFFTRRGYADSDKVDWTVNPAMPIKQVKSELARLQEIADAGKADSTMFGEMAEYKEILTRVARNNKKKGARKLTDTAQATMVMGTPRRVVEYGDIAMELPKDLIKVLEKPFQDKGNVVFAKVAEVAGNMRLLTAAMDLSAPFIQGLPLLGYRPDLWAKSVYQSLKFLNPKNYAKYMAESGNMKLHAIQARSGGAIAYSEMYESMGTVKRFFSKTLMRGKAPKVGSAIEKGFEGTYGRAEMVFSGFGQVARDNLWKSFLATGKYTKPEQLTELATMFNKMTGVMSSEALGIGLSQRQFESAFMFFAPRYVRASLAFIADAFRGGMSGNVARQALGQLAAGGLAMYTGSCLALGQEPKLDINDSEFMTIKIGNDNIGIGGMVTAIGRLAANIYAAGQEDPMQLVKPFTDYGALNRWDNPFIKFMYARTSPFTSLINAAVVESNDYFGQEFESVADWARFLGDKVTPIALQRLTPWAEEEVSLGAVAAEFAGMRTWSDRKVRTYEQFKRQAYNDIEIEVWASYPRELEEIANEISKLKNKGGAENLSKARQLEYSNPSVVFALKKIAIEKQKWLFGNTEANWQAQNQ